ncbi:MAG: hypothetical protein ABEI96_10530 [Haloarculaceae archaeon]
MTSTTTWRTTLVDLTGNLFLVAGVAWLALDVIEAVGATVLVTAPGGVSGLLPLLIARVPVTAGLALSFASVLLLYPRLARRTPLLAALSRGFVVAAPAVYLVVLGWELVAVLHRGVRSAMGQFAFVAPLLLGAWYLFFLGLAATGLALCRTDGSSRLAGAGYLGLVVAWNVPLAVSKLTGDVPDWLFAVTPVVGGLAMVALGYALSFGRDVPDGKAATVDV